MSKLKIHTGIATHLADNSRMLKDVSTFLVLKSEINTSVLFDYREKLGDMALLCGISLRTFYTRLKSLMKLKLVTVYGGRLQLVSYRKMNEILDIEYTGRFEYRKYTSKSEYILRTLAIKENFDRQQSAIKRKIEKEMKGSGLKPEKNEVEAVKAADKKRLTLNFIHRKHEEHIDVPYNPDVAIGQARMATLFGLKSQTSGWYWQQVLMMNKLIEVTNREIESRVRCRKSPMGEVYYSRKTQKTYCRMPNLIAIS